MHITTTRHDLQLTTPFRISRGVEYTAPVITVAIQHGEHTGYGEASPDEYYGESPETVLACLTQFAEQLGDDDAVNVQCFYNPLQACKNRVEGRRTLEVTQCIAKQSG